MSSRSNFQWKSLVEHPEGDNRESRVIMWDYDSALHFCMYSGKNEETGEKNPEYTENDMEHLQWKLNELTFKVLNFIEEKYNLLSINMFVKGKSNFRKELHPIYKSSRKPPNPVIYKLYDYAKVAFNTIESRNCESEDEIFSMSKRIDNNGIIVYIDHDLEEINSLFLNYRTFEWVKIDKETALYNKYKKLILGEGAEDANFTIGCGEKYFNDHFKLGMSVEQYEEATWQAFLKSWSDVEVVGKKKIKTENTEKAREMLDLAKKIIWLKDVGDLDKID